MLSPYSPFYKPHCIHCRLPEQACICSQIISVELPFNIVICSHNKEWQRNDNTAQWGIISSPNIKRIRWQRRSEYIKTSIPLAQMAQQEGHYLLFPSDDAQDIQQMSDDTQPLSIKQLWVIDGTWQEAQKMLRQSPWLKAMMKVKISTEQNQPISSQFQLRRNQQGLSTLEAISCAIAVKSPAAAQSLMDNFHLCQDALLNLKK